MCQQVPRQCSSSQQTCGGLYNGRTAGGSKGVTVPGETLGKREKKKHAEVDAWMYSILPSVSMSAAPPPTRALLVFHTPCVYRQGMDAVEEKSSKAVDIYRDTWVRFLGYANEVGEAFRALVPVSLVWGSYAVATAYVTADAVDKGKKAAVAHGDNPGRTTRVAVAVVDTFVWQALASVIIPGFTINRVCAASLYMLGRTTKWPLPLRKWTTTAIGLSTIPFIITPIDRSVDFLLDSSLRKIYSEGEKHE